MPRKRLPAGKMKGKQRGRAVHVKGYKAKGKKRVAGYRRGKPGGKRG